VSDGTLAVKGFPQGLAYSYNPETQNKNAVSDLHGQHLDTRLNPSGDILRHPVHQRTIQSFSKGLELKKGPVKHQASFPVLKKFVDYYGSETYADDWLQAVFSGGSTDFKNGNADFSAYGNDSRVGKPRSNDVQIRIACAMSPFD
jgi:hypothetical protein